MVGNCGLIFFGFLPALNFHLQCYRLRCFSFAQKKNRNKGKKRKKAKKRTKNGQKRNKKTPQTRREETGKKRDKTRKKRKKWKENKEERKNGRNRKRKRKKTEATPFRCKPSCEIPILGWLATEWETGPQPTMAEEWPAAICAVGGFSTWQKKWPQNIDKFPVLLFLVFWGKARKTTKNKDFYILPKRQNPWKRRE